MEPPGGTNVPVQASFQIGAFNFGSFFRLFSKDSQIHFRSIDPEKGSGGAVNASSLEKSSNSLTSRELPEMGKLKDKIAGRTKQVIAELTGDGKLAEEGKEQEKKAESKPLNNLDKLT